RLVEGRIILPSDRVEGDSQQGRLHDVPFLERRFQIGGIEPFDPVPQGEIRRDRLLGLEADHSPHRFRHIQPLPIEQELSLERCPIEETRIHGYRLYWLTVTRSCGCAGWGTGPAHQTRRGVAVPMFEIRSAGYMVGMSPSDAPSLIPPVRGDWTDLVLRRVRGETIGTTPPIPDDPVTDDDLQLALYLCYELSYRGLEEVPDKMEWDLGILE